jgi:hypothetical protein
MATNLKWSCYYKLICDCPNVVHNTVLPLKHMCDLQQVNLVAQVPTQRKHHRSPRARRPPYRREEKRWEIKDPHFSADLMPVLARKSSLC